MRLSIPEGILAVRSAWDEELVGVTAGIVEVGGIDKVVLCSVDDVLSVLEVDTVLEDALESTTLGVGVGVGPLSVVEGGVGAIEVLARMQSVRRVKLRQSWRYLPAGPVAEVVRVDMTSVVSLEPVGVTSGVVE